MSIKFGEVDSNQILQNEFKIMVLERAIDRLVQKNVNINGLTRSEITSIRKEVAEILANKYPKSGIEYREDS